MNAEKLLTHLDSRTFTPSQVKRMDGSISKKEVSTAISTMKRNKSAGPDGIAAEFYKEFSSMIELELQRTLNEAHKEGTLPNSFLEGEVCTPYKKGDPRNVRNYRPITLLNADYKILAKILALRLKRTINTITSTNQNGFVPGRLLFDNYFLSQLVQAYIDEVDDRGLMIFLDIEKAFDTVSWAYMTEAMTRLKIGPTFMRWIELMYNPSTPPRRRVRTNGEYGDWFSILSGVAQGCPLSPLLFIFATEAFTRAVINDPKLKGVTINNITFIISHFADDTVFYLRNWAQLPRMWKLIQEWGDATGLRCNRYKTEGMRLGRYKRTTMYTGEGTEGIKWVKPGEWIRSLGLPLGEDFSTHDFCQAIYRKVKRKLVVWGRKVARELTIYGRAMMVNSFIYSTFRFYAMALEIPKDIMNAIESDVQAIIWNRDMSFDPEELGTDLDRRPLYKAGVELLPRRELGLGLLHWPSHVKALQVKVLLRYLDATRGEWKDALDAWLARLPEGRGAILTRYPINTLTRSNSGRSTYLPALFKRALFALRDMTLTPMVPGEVTCREEALAEPYWVSQRINVSGIRNVQLWRDQLEMNSITDCINHDETRLYTSHELRTGWINHLATLDPTGQWIRLDAKTEVKKAEVCKQWDTMIKRIPAYITHAACSETTRLVGSGINAVAGNIMRAWGWKGKGMGRQEDGVLYPPEPGTPREKGLGLGARPMHRQSSSKDKQLDIAIYEINGHTTYGTASEGIRKEYRLDPLGRPSPTGENLEWVTEDAGPFPPSGGKEALKVEANSPTPTREDGPSQRYTTMFPSTR